MLASNTLLTFYAIPSKVILYSYFNICIFGKFEVFTNLAIFHRCASRMLTYTPSLTHSLHSNWYQVHLGATFAPNTLNKPQYNVKHLLFRRAVILIMAQGNQITSCCAWTTNTILCCSINIQFSNEISPHIRIVCCDSIVCCFAAKKLLECEKFLISTTIHSYWECFLFTLFFVFLRYG